MAPKLNDRQVSKTTLQRVKKTKEMITRHARDVKKNRGGGKKRKRRRITVDSSCNSSLHSNESRALQVRMPARPRKMSVPAPQIQLPQSTSTMRQKRQLHNPRLQQRSKLSKSHRNVLRGRLHEIYTDVPPNTFR